MFRKQLAVKCEFARRIAVSIASLTTLAVTKAATWMTSLFTPIQLIIADAVAPSCFAFAFKRSNAAPVAPVIAPTWRYSANFWMLAPSNDTTCSTDALAGAGFAVTHGLKSSGLNGLPLALA